MKTHEQMVAAIYVKTDVLSVHRVRMFMQDKANGVAILFILIFVTSL